MTTSVTASGSVRSFDRLLIGGVWSDPAGPERIDVISPITEEVIGSVPAAGVGDVDRAVEAARSCFDDARWSGLHPAERADVMNRVGDALEKRLDELVPTFTSEVGAPLAVSQAFHRMAIQMWREAAKLAAALCTEETRTWDGGSGTVLHEPVGVVAAVIPWNGPVANGSLKVAAALAAGCPVILKPAWEGPTTTLILSEALTEAGFPEGVISVLPGDREVGEYLVGHPGVDKVSFTGSTAAGRRVMEVCSHRLARVTLELGGKSAGIICDDIALDEVLPSLVGGSVGHSGQVCAAITRVLVSREREREAVEVLADALKALRVGDPFDPETEIGPLVAERQRSRVEGYIKSGRDAGARVVVGGGRPEHLERGWFVEPTLFDHVDNSMRIAREEIFGPVIVVIPYDDLDDAIAIANDSDYGLSGAVYSNDVESARGIAKRLRTGQIYLNNTGVCTVQPMGGYKQSGIGREGGIEGVQAFLETKLIVDPVL
jgi:aldehyde dehydrogenase (NAD+)